MDNGAGGIWCPMSDILSYRAVANPRVFNEIRPSTLTILPGVVSCGHADSSFESNRVSMIVPVPSFRMKDEKRCGF